MSDGYSIHIGLNAVDPQHYAGWSGPLVACEADAIDMAAIARSMGMKEQVLLTAAGTRHAVTSAIEDAARRLAAGDLLLLTYSGHGAKMPDLNADETDHLDETWCLYDGELLDDELYALWGRFAAGVRICVLSDSCHSGTVTRARRRLLAGNAPLDRGKVMPPEIALRVYQQHKHFYDELLKQRDMRARIDRLQATVLLLSGCQDNQLSGDGTFNGVFTAQLKAVWNGGRFVGSYRAFHKAIVRDMPEDQTPQLTVLGPDATAFLRQRPFTV